MQKEDRYLEQEALERQVIMLERQLREHYRKVGMQLLELAETEGREAGRLVDEIVLAKQKLARLRGLRRCEHCGVLGESDSRYCRACGNELGESSDLPLPTDCEDRIRRIK